MNSKLRDEIVVDQSQYYYSNADFSIISHYFPNSYNYSSFYSQQTFHIILRDEILSLHYFFNSPFLKQIGSCSLAF